MTQSSHEELDKLIAHYRQELLTTYANREPDPEPTIDLPAPPMPSEEESAPPSADQSDTPSTGMPPVPREYVSDLTDIGRLQVRVSTENEAIPIAGAVVTVTDPDGALMRLMTTDTNGLTDIIDLPTKPRELSLSPENAQPYATYTINVTADGYFQKRFTDLPIYGGVTAIQSVSMIPLPEAGDDDIVLQYPQNGGPTML